nr:hypothetical protein [Tanacetum cinerariifolium]
TDTSFLVNHNAYMASSSAPQISYAQMDQQSPEYSPPEAGLVVPVFQKGDDPIDAINHMMSFLTYLIKKTTWMRMTQIVMKSTQPRSPSWQSCHTMVQIILLR